MQRIRITKNITIPDRLTLERCAKAPELGPRILFFSGGSAMKDVSRELITYTHNSIHLITPFDSGGSSAELRKAFKMLSVGDFRNRLMSLADQSVRGNPDIFKLFSYRLPSDGDPALLKQKLESMIAGKYELVARITDPMRKIIRNHLGYFYEKMPPSFNLRGASIGNLILAGGYLNNRRHIDPVIFIFSKLAEVRGLVRPVVNKNLHLVAELENGEKIVEQHKITGKESAPIASRIRKLYLSKNRRQLKPVDVPIRNKVRELIAGAELICYPIGSFYSSVIANLLPAGVGKAVSLNGCPKVYVPNAGLDPEQYGMTAADGAETLLVYLKAHLSGRTPAQKLLNYVLVDSRNVEYTQGLDLRRIKKLGVAIIDVPLSAGPASRFIDPVLLAEALVSLA